MRDIAPPLLAWFASAGRAVLPWRTDRAPYRIVVAEFMLQQTQVERVRPIFVDFTERWGTFQALADASQADVVRAWRGLGYNSRAVRLHKLARVVVERHGGRLPSDEAQLLALPGVGSYTARAIRAFAFDADVVAVDSNVRRIVHRTQLGLEWPPLAGPTELDALAHRLLPANGGYAFNSALMDLGSRICTSRTPACVRCPLAAACTAAPVDLGELRVRSAAFARPKTPQERIAFVRTTRFVRGRVVERLRHLGPEGAISLLDLHASLAPEVRHHDRTAVEDVVAGLVGEGVVERVEGRFRLAR